MDIEKEQKVSKIEFLEQKKRLSDSKVIEEKKKLRFNKKSPKGKIDRILDSSNISLKNQKYKKFEKGTKIFEKKFCFDKDFFIERNS